MMNGTASSYILESEQILTRVYSLVSGYGDDHNHLFSLDSPTELSARRQRLITRLIPIPIPCGSG